MKKKNFAYVAMATTVSATSVLGYSTNVSSAENKNNSLPIVFNIGKFAGEEIGSLDIEVKENNSEFKSMHNRDNLFTLNYDENNKYVVRVSVHDKKWTSDEYEITFKKYDNGYAIPITKNLKTGKIVEGEFPEITIRKKENGSVPIIPENPNKNDLPSNQDKENIPSGESDKDKTNAKISLDSFKVRVLKNNAPMTDAKLSFSEIDMKAKIQLPNIIQQNIPVDEKGEYSFSGMKPNTTYEIRVNTKNIKLDRESVRFSTDSNKKIVVVDGLKVTNASQGTFVFNAVDKNDT
ncbi:MAG: hypothetical protein SPJ36_03615, partial [Peptostreptococcus porci]|nr:hypothetical protein [Peptostreptococcus porci]